VLFGRWQAQKRRVATWGCRRRDRHDLAGGLKETEERETEHE
jgi:hypothetical protein